MHDHGQKITLINDSLTDIVKQGNMLSSFKLKFQE